MIRENFVITIGDFGSIVILHSGNKIKKSIYIKNLEDENELTDLKTIFKENNAPIAILLDNLDQTYKKKTYPLVGLTSLRNIAKREMGSDADTTSFKNYIPYVPKRSSAEKHSECLFISASRSELIDKWIEFVMNLPNRVTGIYVLPVESSQLLNLLTRKNALTGNTIVTKKGQTLSCLILKTKVGGIRQLVFCNNSIVFTRIVNYDFNDHDCLERYEQDLYSTFEYLKRSFPNIKITDLNFYNIFEQSILDKLNAIENKELRFTNYTPRQAGKKCGFNNMIASEEEYCDILISKIFFNKKKILKFTTKQIQRFEQLFFLIWGSYALNGLVILAIFFSLVSIGLYSSQTTYVMERSKRSRDLAETELKNTQVFEEQENISARNYGAPNVERIIDFGQVDEKLNQDNEPDFLEFYSQLSFLKKYNSKLSSFRFFVDKFDYKKPTNKLDYLISIEGSMHNQSGDIDDLFKNFDNLSSAAVSTFKNYKVGYEEIPRTINFTKKYYEYPVNFTISNQKR